MSEANGKPITRYSKLRLFDFIRGLPEGLDRLSPDDYARLRDAVSDAMNMVYEIGREDGRKESERESEEARAAALAAYFDNLLRAQPETMRATSH